MPLNKITPQTQAFPAGTFNTLVDMARAQQLPGVADPQRTAKDRIRYVPYRGDVTIPRGAVMVPRGYRPLDNGFVIQAEVMQDSIPAPFLLVALESIQAGATDIAAAAMYQPCRALYQTTDGTPAFGEQWGPTYDGTWKLRKGAPGFTILGRPADGLVDCVYNPSAALLFQSTAAIGARSGGTVEGQLVNCCYPLTATIGASYREVANTSAQLRVWNLSSQAFGAGKYGIALPCGGHQFAIFESCG